MVTFAPLLFAVDPNFSLNQYLHTSFTQEEGNALPPIHALAQTSDGYLWLGSATGLWRFDGMRFLDWSATSGAPLPGTDIRCLRRASDGSLWVGSATGIWRVDHGRVLRFPATEKLPCKVILAMLEDRAGGLWMLTECADVNTLAMLTPAGDLRIFGPQDGLPDQKPRTLFQDRQGTLWIGTESAVCRWLPGSKAVCSPGPRDLVSISETAAGELAIADGILQGVLRLPSTGGRTEPLGPRMPDSSFMRGAMITDRDGNIWIGTTGQGLLRLRDKGMDRFTTNEGLSNNLVYSILEDQEGDIWIATARGIDRIRDPKVQLFSRLNGLSGDAPSAVYGARDGAVWIGMSGGGVNLLAGDRVSQYTASAGLPNGVVMSLFEESPGHLFVATTAGLAAQAGNRFAEIRTADGQRLAHAFNISGNSSGAVWAADIKLGLFSVQNGVAHLVTTTPPLSPDIYSLLVVRNGDVWLGHYRGGISVLNSGAVRRFDPRDGLAEGPVQALYEDREGTVWAGTAKGLSRFRNGSWVQWSSAEGLPEGGVQSITEDQIGGLWLMTPAGVLRVSLSDLQSPGKMLPNVRYGQTEGLRLQPGGSTGPRLTRASDGRLWLCTENGVAVIDPARVKRNPVPPPVVIEQVIADGKAFDRTVPGPVVFRGRDLQIIYTANSLMAPERVRFRYRLSDRDRGWVDGGSRRLAVYGALPPGSYRFQVIASNNDGEWNKTGDAIALRVDPYFYQTKWFALVCISTISLLVWSAHRLKMRQVIERVQLIAAERVRFSRELHDSLLQGFSGVVFLLEAAARQFDAAPELSKQRLERALDQADQSLREARQMIVSMRIPALENNTLPEALRTTIAQMVSGVPVDYHFELKGRARPRPYDVEANFFLIAREAVTNSLNHASATRIRLELCYTPKELHLTVQDNGTGFDPEMAMSKTGHWGFRGMRERARLIGAAFDVDTAPGSGTKIEVAVPCKK